MPHKSATPLIPYAGTRMRPTPAGTSGADTVAAVTISDLRVHYTSAADPVLSIAHLNVARGESLALTGANGAGKSTLLKVITGLVRAERGDVRVFGRPSQRARGCIAYLPQLRAVDWHYPINVFDFALLGCSLRLGWLRRPGTVWRNRTQELLARLRLDALSTRPIRALSGGEQQRLLLVRALLADPDLFLLDEPLTAVDADSVGLIGDILEQEHRSGKTLIVATHHLDFGGIFRFDRELQLHCGCVHAIRNGAATTQPASGGILARRLSAPVAFYSGEEAAAHLGNNRQAAAHFADNKQTAPSFADSREAAAHLADNKQAATHLADSKQAAARLADNKQTATHFSDNREAADNTASAAAQSGKKPS